MDIMEIDILIYNFPNEQQSQKFHIYLIIMLHTFDRGERGRGGRKIIQIVGLNLYTAP